MYPIYGLLVSTSVKFHSVSLYDQHFWVRGHFETSAPIKWPQIDLEPYKVKSPYMCIKLLSSSLKFPSVSLYGQLFSRYRPFWNKSTEWPQIDLKHYKVI